jgi:hypothetical protein
VRRPWNILLGIAAFGPFVAAAMVTAELEPLVFDIGTRASTLLESAPDGADAWEPPPLVAPSPVRARSDTTEPACGAKRRRPATPRALHVSAERVLAIANSGMRPTGTPVPAVSVRPAGIVVSGVSAMGIGVEDGDVLTHVEGIAVATPGEVVALVLSARAHEAGSMRARLFRGERPYVVVVDMPYVEPEPEPISRRAGDGLRGATALR